MHLTVHNYQNKLVYEKLVINKVLGFVVGHLPEKQTTCNDEDSLKENSTYEYRLILSYVPHNGALCFKIKLKIHEINPSSLFTWMYVFSIG